MKKQLNISAQEQNNLIAAENRKVFREKGITVLNIIGSPGCGKTAILEYLARHFPEPFSVVIGDVKTALDADRLIQAGHADSHAIETGGSCHLSALMVQKKLSEINLNKIKYLFIENVGNLVCPSAFDLGEAIKIAVLSLPEGDEKVRKYPALFLRAAAVLINKIDLLPHLAYDVEQVKKDCLAHNPRMEIFTVSAKTGAGMTEWIVYLQKRNFAAMM